MREDILLALNEVEDPELGIGIVDLGLIYRADWNENGIEVDFTTTSPSCPYEEMLMEQINGVLYSRFGEAASIRLRLVRHPEWTPQRITETARQKMGWTRGRRTSTGKTISDLKRACGVWEN